MIVCSCQYLKSFQNGCLLHSLIHAFRFSALVGIQQRFLKEIVKSENMVIKSFEVLTLRISSNHETRLHRPSQSAVLPKSRTT